MICVLLRPVGHVGWKGPKSSRGLAQPAGSSVERGLPAYIVKLEAFHFPEWPPHLSGTGERCLLQAAIDFALSHGLAVRPFAGDDAEPADPAHGHVPQLAGALHAPVTLFPTLFPASCFERAKSIQKRYNELYAKVATDHTFLTETLADVIKVDDFQKRLADLWRQSKKDGAHQRISLGLFRSDYLLHAPTAKPGDVEGSTNSQGVDVGRVGIKQVEFNTIASSFGALSQRVSEMHQYLLDSTHYLGASELLDASRIPKNTSLEALANGLALAHIQYLKQQSLDRSSPHVAIIFIVQENERNVFDQKLLEYELMTRHHIKVIRLTLTEAIHKTRLSHPRCALVISEPVGSATGMQSELECSVVYYRSGYGPADYTNDGHWQARLTIEKSLAIKCPSVALQLAGAKKVQQVLAQRDTLEKFLPDGADLDALQETFAGLWPLDAGSPEGESAYDMALKTPERFVIKPCREGGGNNIYRNSIPAFLKALPKSERAAYILMELIEPPAIRNALAKAGTGRLIESEVISELGIYGYCLFESKDLAGEETQILHNESAGHLLRTKGRDSDEGGVAVGFAVIDSPLLI